MVSRVRMTSTSTGKEASMALSEKWVLGKARSLLWNPRYTGFNPIAFTRAIEAEARKDDEALIWQLVERV